IRISLDSNQILNHPLRLGLSTEVHVDIHSLKNQPLSKEPLVSPLYTTKIFSNEELGSEALIETIFKENLFTNPSEFDEEDLP
ncbi:MAG: hypothetical protein JSS09_08555, partial [Verrucomicrobia bacterium]|nr:hypothetical protein [Verrucomicrobiota bacterium]